MYSAEPTDKKQYTDKNDREYGRFARVYDVGVKILPVWRNWITQVIPHIVGPRVLEISFGTGYLLAQYADRFDSYGIDYNWEMACTAKRNLESKQMCAAIQQADVTHLPYPSETFDTVVNTMAFTGYPDGQAAMTEIYRVLKENGRFVLVDIDYPKDQNWLGMKATRLWASVGDILRDMDDLFRQTGFAYTEEEIGGFGSVHLYVAVKTS